MKGFNRSSVLCILHILCILHSLCIQIRNGARGQRTSCQCEHRWHIRSKGQHNHSSRGQHSRARHQHRQQQWHRHQQTSFLCSILHNLCIHILCKAQDQHQLQHRHQHQQTSFLCSSLRIHHNILHNLCIHILCKAQDQQEQQRLRRQPKGPSTSSFKLMRAIGLPM